MSEDLQIRRWPRYRVDLPVRVTYSQSPKIVIPGRVTEISEGGMMLCPGMDFEPGDLIEIEFQTAGFPSLVSLVRSRTEQGFGLEFLTVLPTDESNFWEGPPPWLAAIAEDSGTRIEPIASEACPSDRAASQVLQQKELQIKRVQEEIAALQVVAALLAEQEAGGGKRLQADL
jgi:hypothetical protein